MDPRQRRELARYGAPAAFLAAATIAVLLIKAGLGGSGSGDATPTAGALPTVASTTTRPTTRITLTAPPATATTTAETTTASSTATTSTESSGQYYTVASGDTLGGIAAKYGTTVANLMTLNPGIDPAALRVGQRVRVS